MKGKKQRGRPRTRPDDTVVFNAQMSQKAKNRLKALAQIEDRYAYAVLETAFWDFWDRLPDDRRQAADQIARAVEGARQQHDD